MKSLHPTHRLLSCLALAPLPPLTAPAQEDAGRVDDMPDASVGSGGADRDSPEGEDSTGRPGGACRSGDDRAARFSDTGIRQAERVGCLLGPEEPLARVGLGLVAARRRGREGR